MVRQKLELLVQAVGHRGAAGHVESVLLEDDLAPEGVRVLQQQPFHGPPGGLHLRLVGGQGQPAGPVKAGGHVLVAHEGVGVVAGEAALDAVHVVGGPAQAHGVAPALLQGVVKLLQIRRQFYIKFLHIKPLIVLPGQIDHIPVGDPPKAVVGDHAPKHAPLGGLFGHQPVIGAVQLF